MLNIYQKRIRCPGLEGWALQKCTCSSWTRCLLLLLSVDVWTALPHPPPPPRPLDGTKGSGQRDSSSLDHHPRLPSLLAYTLHGKRDILFCKYSTVHILTNHNIRNICSPARRCNCLIGQSRRSREMQRQLCGQKDLVDEKSQRRINRDSSWQKDRKRWSTVVADTPQDSMCCAFWDAFLPSRL